MGIWTSSPPVSLQCLLVLPGPVLCTGREWGARWGCPGTSGGFCPILTAVTGVLQGAAVSGSRLQCAWPLCAQPLPGCESLQDLWFEATCWAGRCPWSRAAGWKISQAEPLSPFLSRHRAGPSPGSAAGHPGESHSASLSLELFTCGRGTHTVQGGRPEWGRGCRACYYARRPAPAAALPSLGPFCTPVVFISSCEISTCPAWPHGSWGDPPGDVGGSTL